MKQDTAITNIIFDLGGVIMHGEIDEILPALGARYDVDTSSARPAITQAWVRAMTDPDADDVFWKIMSDTFHRSSAKLLHEFILFPRITNDVLSLLSKLQERFVLSMLSNQIRSWHVPFMQARGLNPYFSNVITSYETGIAKPDERIYRTLLTRCATEPQACLFIDDRAENILSARHLGMRTIHLIEPERLTDELHVQGVDF